MSIPSIHHLFVYGSLRSGFQNPVFEYISAYFNMLGPAKMKGKLYDLGDYPAAIPTNEEFYLTGELYLLRNPRDYEWAFAQLDDYEGIFVEEDEEESAYIRAVGNAHISNEVIPAWVYWYNRPIYNASPIPSGDVIDFLKK